MEEVQRVSERQMWGPCKGSSHAEASSPPPPGILLWLLQGAPSPSLEARGFPRGHLCSALPLVSCGARMLVGFMTPFQALSPLFVPVLAKQGSCYPLLRCHFSFHLKYMSPSNTALGPKPGLAMSLPQVRLPPPVPLRGGGAPRKTPSGILSLSFRLCSRLAISRGLSSLLTAASLGPLLTRGPQDRLLR